MKKIFKIFLIIIIISLFKVSFSFANDEKIKIGLLVPDVKKNADPKPEYRSNSGP